MNFSIKHIALIDNAAACSLANKRGVGKIRHLEGKLLWIQDKTESQELQVERVESALNISDLGTKPLTAVRLKTFSFLLGAMDVASGERVGQAHYEEMMQKFWHGSKVMKIAKVILRLAVLSGSVVAAGSLGGDDLGVCHADDDPDLVATSWWLSSGIDWFGPWHDILHAWKVRGRADGALLCQFLVGEILFGILEISKVYCFA